MVMASTNMDSKLYENRNILKNPGVDNRYAVKKIKQDFSNLGNGEGVSRLSPPHPHPPHPPTSPKFAHSHPHLEKKTDFPHLITIFNITFLAVVTTPVKFLF